MYPTRKSFFNSIAFLKFLSKRIHNEPIHIIPSNQVSDIEKLCLSIPEDSWTNCEFIDMLKDEHGFDKFRNYGDTHEEYRDEIEEKARKSILKINEFQEILRMYNENMNFNQ